MWQNPINNNLKLVSILLLSVFLFQNCVVYHSKTTTLDKAVQSGQKVKIITNNSNIYKFKYLQKQGEQLVGFVHKNSSTTKKFNVFRDTIKYKHHFVPVLISENSIKEIYLKNKTLSTILSIGIPTILTGAIFLTVRSTATFDMSGLELGYVTSN